MRNIKAIAAKEFIQLMRDRRTVMMLIMTPVLQVLVYGFGVNTDVKHLKTYLYDQDRTYLTRRLCESFEHSSYFKIISKVNDQASIKDALDKGRAQAGIIIPPAFTADLLKGKTPQLQLLIDGTDSTPATVALNSSQAIITNFMQSQGLVPITVVPIDFRPRLWYNPDLKSTFFLLPGLIAMVLYFLVPMITANSIVREKEQGNIEQLLVTPIKPYELILGKIIPYIGLGMLITVLIVLSICLIFSVPLRGNPLTLFVMSFVYLIVCLGIGLWASTVATSQQQASQFVMMTAMPSILLSGFIFPRETMPDFVYQLGHILPMTYFLKIVRGIMLKGMSFMDLLDQVIPLLIMAVVVIYLATKRFSKRMD